ncbi:MAG TPA: hypothetical protein VH092_14720 [Urbifossiella sp.]|jgi:hypothetical protein|nr:hypothetical protein [Urbifossiella sp.]
MADDLTAALSRLADWAEPRLRADPELSAAVAAVARAVAAWAERLPAATKAPPAPAEPVAPAATAVPLAQLPPLRFHLDPPPTPAPTSHDDRELALVPPTLVAERCRAKGEACRLVSRRSADAQGGRDNTAEAALQARAAALPDCNLWMLNHEPVVTAPRAWEDLAGAFSAAADAAGLLHAWEQSPGPVADRLAPKVLGLAAEAQSILLYAVADVRDVRMDYDQVQLFARVRTTARDRHIFIPRYLKREDRADPASWPDVVRRVADLRSQFQTVGDRDKVRVKALNNLRFKIGRFRERPEESAGEWARVLELVDELVTGGLPPSHADLRDLLLPVVEDVPDEPPPPPNVQLVLREIDRYVESRPDAEPPARPPRPTPEVAEVADLLRGREVVLIGGQARPAHKAALMRAFGLADVRWLVTPEHTSFTVFEPDIARPEVAAVLLAIRWSNHDYDNVKEYCETYGKPLVRLPGGYNANQVAHHILAQAGARLQAARAAAG